MFSFSQKKTILQISIVLSLLTLLGLDNFSPTECNLVDSESETDDYEYCIGDMIKNTEDKFAFCCNQSNKGIDFFVLIGGVIVPLLIAIVDLQTLEEEHNKVTGNDGKPAVELQEITEQV